MDDPSCNQETALFACFGRPPSSDAYSVFNMLSLTSLEGKSNMI